MNDGKKRKEKTRSFSAWKTMEMSLKIIRIKKFSTETNSVVWMCLRQHCINNDCQAIAVWFSFDFNEISQSQTRVRLCKKNSHLFITRLFYNCAFCNREWSNSQLLFLFNWKRFRSVEVFRHHCTSVKLLYNSREWRLLSEASVWSREGDKAWYITKILDTHIQYRRHLGNSAMDTTWNRYALTGRLSVCYHCIKCTVPTDQGLLFRSQCSPCLPLQKCLAWVDMLSLFIAGW